MEVGNTHYWAKGAPCPRCGNPLNSGTVFNNVPKNCEERGITYPYMAVGESMHMECYIETVIETCIKERLDDRESRE